MSDVHYQLTQYGFEYGSAEVTRIYSDKKSGSITLEVKTPKGRLQIYVTKTGKIRVYKSIKIKYVCGPNVGKFFEGLKEITAKE